MREKVKRVMDFIHNFAFGELYGKEYAQFLESITYEIERELDEESWQENEEEE